MSNIIAAIGALSLLRGDGGAHRGLILDHSVDEGGYQAGSRAFKPRLELHKRLLPDRGLERVNQYTGLHQARHARHRCRS